MDSLVNPGNTKTAHMQASILKYQYRQLRKSKIKSYDFFNLLYAWLFRPHNSFISRRVQLRGKGKFKPANPFYFDVLVNRLTWAKGDKSVLSLSEKARFSPGKNVRISGGCRLHIDGDFSIGDNTYINPHTIVISNESISIGNSCAISFNCQLMDTDMHDITIDGFTKPKTAGITIGDNVWIGSQCTILKGVSIGNGAVIAAGSVVTRSIPAGAMAAGVPAKVIKENVSWKP